MSTTEIVLLLLVVPVLLFIWLRREAESEYRSAWGRVFRSWRRVSRGRRKST